MKYMGSKSRIAKYIVPILQRCIDDNAIEKYIEPFVGGGNIIDKINCKERIGADANQYLIGLLKYVASGGELLNEVTKEYYDHIKHTYKQDIYPDWIVGNVGFLASFNGRWFDGGYARPGYEKIKTGQRYRNYYQESKNNLMCQASHLKDVHLICKDYRQTKIDNDCAMYCDPPYGNTKRYQISMDFDYEEFWNIMREWSSIAYVFISEQAAPDDFIPVWSKETFRSMRVGNKYQSNESLFVMRNGKAFNWFYKK